MDNSNETALTILNQLGGKQFLVLTGSHAVLDRNTLRLRLRKNQSKANFLEITLNGNDLYDMRFFYYRPERVNVDHGTKSVMTMPEKSFEVERLEDACWDMLKDIFEHTTGLYVTLFPRR